MLERIGAASRAAYHPRRQERRQGQRDPHRICAATGTIVAIQDADLELDPAQIAELVQPILDGRTRVVYGSRFLAGTPGRAVAVDFRQPGADRRDQHPVRRPHHRHGDLLQDHGARGAQSLNLESNRFDIEPEITAKLLRDGHSIFELPIRFEPRSRAQGKKIGWRDGVRAIQVLLKYRFSK